MNEHEEDMLARAEALARLEGGTCEWKDCKDPAVEVVETVETIESEGHFAVMSRRWLMCVKHGVIARTVTTECAIGDW